MMLLEIGYDKDDEDEDEENDIMMINDDVLSISK